MATVLSPPEQRTLLRDISWETYQSLLSDRQEKNTPRFTYFQGLLEIMSPLSEHEKITRLIGSIVTFWGHELGIDIVDFGSTTFQRVDLASGFEPDACFYAQSLGRINDQDKIDLSKDPPPDLVVEIDITNSSLNNLPLFAQIGILEVWRYTNRMTIFKLECGSYLEINESLTLPGLTAVLITEFIKRDKSGKRIDVLNLIHERARNVTRNVNR